MKIIFRTALDKYQTNCFPENLTLVPRKGDSVLVTEVFGAYFINQKLPTKLEVVDVIWTEKDVICELWYSEQSVKTAQHNGVNLY